MAKITVMRGEHKVGEFPMKKSPFVVGREAKGGVLIVCYEPGARSRSALAPGFS